MQNCKAKWLEKNDYKKDYFTYQMNMEDALSITNGTSYSPELETIGDWMIRDRVKKISERRSFNPRAFCWATGKRLFLRNSVIVICEITGPGTPAIQRFYFTPRQYTLRLLKDA
jgi:hypothetical protein